MTSNPSVARGRALVVRAMRGRRVTADLAAAVVLTCLSAFASLAQAPDADTPATVVAAQIRSQGYACAEPVAATRDTKASRPLATVWLLRCANARYRVRLVPDMAAEVTQLD